MKPRILHRLIQALFTTCVAPLSITSAFADVPSDYTPVTITDVGQLADYTGADYPAFIIAADIANSTYRMTGAHQYWADYAEYSHSLTFEELSSSANGSAMSIASELVMQNLEELNFIQNSSNTRDGGGGAVEGGSISLIRNNSVSFSGNHTSSVGDSRGGAIRVAGTFSMTGNETVDFSMNYASTNGGTYSLGSTSSGGAISGSVTMTSNDSVTFNGNYTSAVYPSGGGAIYLSSGLSSVTMTGNGSVTFSGNHASSKSSSGLGGVIYASGGRVTMTGNGSVVFRGNYEQDGSVGYRLRSVYLDWDSRLTLVAGEGQNITFYDTLYAAEGTEVSFNDEYEDKDGVTQKGTGDIVFSGAHAEQDLCELQPKYSQAGLTISLTTEVRSTTNLYGGRLRIEDGAIYKGNGINVAADSNATLRLDGSTLNASDYNVTLNESTTLEAAGEDYITADKLDLKDGSRMKLAAGAKLDVNGTISFTAPQETTWSVEGGAEITADKMSGNGSTISSLNNVNVDIIDDYTIENMSISGSVIDISEGTTLYVKHVNIEADARITDEAAWLDMVDTHGWLDNSNTEASAPVMSLGDTLFYRSGDDAWIRLNQDVSYVALTSELFSNVTLTGSDLWLDLTGLADTIGDAQAFSIAFKDALYDVNGLRVVATVDGEHYLDGYYTTKQEGTTTTLYFSAQIPEPTTSTLSLLALAALASRRRKQ